MLEGSEAELELSGTSVVMVTTNANNPNHVDIVTLSLKVTGVQEVKVMFTSASGSNPEQEVSLTFRTFRPKI